MDSTLYQSVSQEKASFYIKYINSRTWRLKRREILKRDNYECRTCCSKEDLEVHHRHYRNLGNEELDDLITLCIQCHDAITSSIRFRRNVKRGVKMSSNLELRIIDVIEQPQKQKQIKITSMSKPESKNKIESSKPIIKLKATKF